MLTGTAHFLAFFLERQRTVAVVMQHQYAWVGNVWRLQSIYIFPTELSSPYWGSASLARVEQQHAV